MRRSHLVEHLKAARRIAEAEGETFLAYLITMAEEAAAKRGTNRDKGETAAA